MQATKVMDSEGFFGGLQQSHEGNTFFELALVKSTGAGISNPQRSQLVATAKHRTASATRKRSAATSWASMVEEGRPAAVAQKAALLAPQAPLPNHSRFGNHISFNDFRGNETIPGRAPKAGARSCEVSGSHALRAFRHGRQRHEDVQGKAHTFAVAPAVGVPNKPMVASRRTKCAPRVESRCAHREFCHVFHVCCSMPTGGAEVRVSGAAQW